MPCTRENPCGAILYEDSQSRELALAGIRRRVQKCLAGHAFWEGDIPTDAIASAATAVTPDIDEEDDEQLSSASTTSAPETAQRTSPRSTLAPKPRSRDRRVGPPRPRRASASEVTVDGFSLEEIQRMLTEIRAAIAEEETVESQAVEAVGA
jgi:hypothetical protein